MFKKIVGGVLWRFTFKQARGVERVLIRTETEDPAEAHTLATWYLGQLNSPAVRFMSVEPAVVATSAQMDAVQRAEAGLEEEVVDALADEMGGPPLRPKPVKTKTSSPHPADRVGA